MAAEELPHDLQLSRRLASEYSQLNELAAQQNAEIKAELRSLAPPSEAVLRQLAKQAWNECWVDTRNKELLWQARDAHADVALIEVLAAYQRDGDAAEGYDLLRRMDDFSAAKVEALLRFGSFQDNGKSYVDSDFLEAARRLVGAYDDDAQLVNAAAPKPAGRPLKLSGLARITYYSRDLADYQAWMAAAQHGAKDRRTLINDLILIASHGYMPAFSVAKDLAVKQAAFLTGASGNYMLEGSINLSDYEQEFYKQAAQLAVIDRRMQLLDIPRLEPPSGRRVDERELDEAFLKLVRSRGVINQLNEGVSLPSSYSPLELEVIDAWQEVATISRLEAEAQLWEYARHRAGEFRHAMASTGQPDFKSLRRQAAGKDYSSLADIPKREVPKFEFDIWALEADEIEYRRTGKRRRHPGQVKLRPEERQATKRRYEAEDADKIQHVQKVFASINVLLLYRALYCHIAGVEQVDTRI